MGVDNNEKTAPKKKRLPTHDIKAVRESLCKLAREVYNGLITESRAKTTAYILGKSLDSDRIMNDIALKERIEKLEQLMQGKGSTIVDQADIESPYAASIKQQLENERRKNNELQSELLSIKRQFAEFQANFEGE